MTSTDLVDIAEWLTDPPEIGVVQRVRAEDLLRDHLACVVSGLARVSARGGPSDEVGSVVRLLALASSIDDLDDVDWNSLHHPGAVVWPVVLGLARSTRAVPETLVRSAYAGYTVAAAFADWLAGASVVGWHVTEMAGAFGAASAAAVLLDLGPIEHARALALAGSSAGGLRMTSVDRRGGGAFNRVAAASLGLHAALAAREVELDLSSPLVGPGSLRVLLGIPAPFALLPLASGLDRACPRLFDAAGLLQGMCHGIWQTRAVLPGRPTRLTVGLAASSRTAVQRLDGDSWWNVKEAARRAWEETVGSVGIGTPFSGDWVEDCLQIEQQDVAVGEATVHTVTTEGELDLGIVGPAPDEPYALRLALNEKIDRIAHHRRGQVDELARGILDVGCDARLLDDLAGLSERTTQSGIRKLHVGP